MRQSARRAKCCAPANGRSCSRCGGVHIRDTALSLDSQTASYYLRSERLEAHKNVVAVSHSTGSILRGPNLTYYRVARGIRDTSEMYATSRPTIDEK